MTDYYDTIDSLIVADAVRESIDLNRIVHVAGAQEEHDDLLVLCDDFVETGAETEYWGEDDVGNAWRVHVHTVSSGTVV